MRILAAALATFCLLPAAASAQKGGPVTLHARGSFEVKLTPQADKDAMFGRMLLDKQFHGDLEATSKGEMLTSVVVGGPAAYVAIERVTGTLRGRSGSFTLVHQGVMSDGGQRLTVTVVPEFNTDQLVGLSGQMTINIVDGKHFYDFEYTLPGR